MGLSVGEIKGPIPCGLKEYLMKVFIRQNATTKTGYEVVSIDELGNENVQSIEKTYPNEPFTLVLPENASNRKYFNRILWSSD